MLQPSIPGFRLGVYVFKDAEIIDFAAPYGVLSVARRFDPEIDALVAPAVDQEVAAWRAVRHGESALAAVDQRRRFVGVIPPDRVVAVLLSEHEEDLSRAGGFLSTSMARRTNEEAVNAASAIGSRGFSWARRGVAGSRPGWLV